MPHIPDQNLAEIDQMLQEMLPEDQRFFLVTSDPQPPSPNETHYDVISNVPPPEATAMLKHVIETIEHEDQPAPDWAG